MCVCTHIGKYVVVTTECIYVCVSVSVDTINLCYGSLLIVCKVAVNLFKKKCKMNFNLWTVLEATVRKAVYSKYYKLDSIASRIMKHITLLVDVCPFNYVKCNISNCTFANAMPFVKIISAVDLF